MSLFNRSKMRAVFAAVIAAALPRAAPPISLRPDLAPTPIPESPDRGFDPYAFFTSYARRAVALDYAPVERLLAWERQGSRGYRWGGARVHPRKRRAHAWA
jgi:hypothetical protein